MSRGAGGLPGLAAAGLGRGRAAALFCAAAAGLGALAAVLHRRMLLALLRARVADVGARFADHPGELAAAAHVAHGKPADCGAIDVERDAAGEHLDVLFAQAGSGAVVAGDGAGVAGIDAGLER